MDGIQPPEVEAAENRLHVVCDTSATAPGNSDHVTFAGPAIRPSSTIVLDSKLSLVSRCFPKLRRIKSRLRAVSMDSGK